MIGLSGTVVTVPVALIAVALLGWTTWTAFQARKRPNARPFVASLTALTAWALLTLGATLAVALSASSVAETLRAASAVPALAVPGVWTVYVLGYAGRGTGLTRRRIVLISGTALPVVFGVAMVGVVAVQPPESIANSALLVLLSLLIAALVYLFALFAYAAYVLIRLGRQHALIPNLQIATLLLGISTPYIGGLLETLGQVTNGIGVGLLVSGGLFAVAVQRFPVLTRFPRSESVARTHVVEALQETVVVLDWDGHVLDANRSMARLFDRSTNALVGEPIWEVVAGIGGIDLSAGTEGTVWLRTTRGHRQFQYSVSAVDASDGSDQRQHDPVARAVVFRDVTERQAREQRLAVLNRILRHNVRNRLDIVIANANQIDDDTLRTNIHDNATALVQLGKKAREAERLMENSTDSPEPVNLVTIAADVAQQYQDTDSDGELTLSCPDELSIRSHPALVRKLLSELVDNALSHTGGSAPCVEITVRSCGEPAAEMIVADNGPGIPEHERSVLTDGTETQLKHGRGIGLWMVKWAVIQLGGEIDFTENDPHGSVVTVRLPDGDYGSRERSQE